MCGVGMIHAAVSRHSVGVVWPAWAHFFSVGAGRSRGVALERIKRLNSPAGSPADRKVTGWKFSGSLPAPTGDWADVVPTLDAGWPYNSTAFSRCAFVFHEPSLGLENVRKVSADGGPSVMKGIRGIPWELTHLIFL